MMMRFQDKGGWELDPCCPCDGQFVEYFRVQGLRGKVVFHFGSGLHHLVGRELGGGGDNDVWSITASREEYNAYIDAVIERPELGRHYRLIFGDVYALTPGVLPSFDLVTLFHLCEPLGTDDGARLMLDGTSLVRTFLERLKPGGQLLFYEGSNGWPTASSVVRSMEKMGSLRKVGAHEALSIYEPA